MKTDTELTDTELRHNVEAELEWEPSVDARTIAQDGAPGSPAGGIDCRHRNALAARPGLLDGQVLHQDCQIMTD